MSPPPITGGSQPWRSSVDAIRQGYPVEEVDHLIESGRLSMAEIDRMVMPRKTLSHRRSIGTLTSEQSDRLSRVARTISMAEEAFGSVDTAHRWLRRETHALGGERPLDLLDTSAGSREVEDLIGRVSHGIAA